MLMVVCMVNYLCVALLDVYVLVVWQLLLAVQQLHVKFMHIHFKVNVSFLGTKPRDKSSPRGSAVKEQ